MARFPFSISSRKKHPVQAPLPPDGSFSKAHKILGSTPLNIDAHAGWDDASSSIISDDRSQTTATSYPESELREQEDDYHVNIVTSEEGWDEESDVLPDPLRFHAPNVIGISGTAATDDDVLRNSRSSSTIKSWYDKSKLPLSVSQQTSSSAIALGLPSKAQRVLDAGNLDDSSRVKKKPARLDLSQTSRKYSGAAKQDGEAGSALGHMLRSPSILSPFSPMSTRSRESRKLQRKRTNENLNSPAHNGELPRPGTGGSNRLVPRESPSLYDHYEQMSLRDVLRQNSTTSLPIPEEELLPVESTHERSPKAHSRKADAVKYGFQGPPTPKTALFTKPDWGTSSKNGARPSSSRQRRDHGADKSFKNTNLQQTSVLLLSSDSEDEDDEEGLADIVQSMPTGAANPSSAPAERLSKMENGIRPSEASLRPQTSRGPNSDDKLAGRSSRQTKRQNFPTTASSNTKPRSPERERNSQAVANPRVATPLGSLSHTASSSRTSVMSDFSMTSELTEQGKSVYGIQEARAVTMLSARRPSQVEMEQEGDASKSSDTKRTSSSTGQLTPPLSPTSVDFYIRSAHSSIDGPGSHSRLMAVTHREEMLLSALRNKHHSMRERPLSQLREGEPEGVDLVSQKPAKPEVPDRSDSSPHGSFKKGHQSKGSQTTLTGDTFDFGFPAPPSAKEGKSGEPQDSPTVGCISASGDVVKSPNAKRLSTVLLSPIGPPPSFALPEIPMSKKSKSSLKSLSSRETVSSQSQQDVPLYLDDGDLSPDMDDIRDWDSATSSVAEAITSNGFVPVSRPGQKSCQPQSQQMSTSPKTYSLAFGQGQFGFSRPNVRKQDTADEDESYGVDGTEDVPRPDSPISPDSFPALPTKRMTQNNMARLSAVGPGIWHSNNPETGWWGDND